MVIRGDAPRRMRAHTSSDYAFPAALLDQRCWGVFEYKPVDGGWETEPREPQACTFAWAQEAAEGRDNHFVCLKIPKGHCAVALKDVRSRNHEGDVALEPWADAFDDVAWETNYVDRGAPPYDWVAIGQAPPGLVRRSSPHVEILPADALLPLAGGWFSKGDKQPAIDAPLGRILQLADAQIDRECATRTLAAMTAAELLATPRETRWLIYRVLEAGVMALLIGRRSSFKSFVVLHWAMTLAVAGSPVVLISAEGIGLRNRIEAWLKRHAPTADPASLPVLAIERRVDLTTAGDRAAIRAAVAAWGKRPTLIAVDTLAKCAGALNLDNNSAVSRMLGELNDELRQPYDATLLVVTHTGHSDQNRARGAPSLEADTEAAYVVRRKGTDQGFTVSRQRFKDYGELPPMRYAAHVVNLGRNDAAGNPVTSLALEQLPDGEERTENEPAEQQKAAAAGGHVQRQLRDTLAELTRDRSPATVSGRELSKAMRDQGVKRQSLHVALKALERDGVIERSASGDQLTVKKKLP